MVIYIIIKIGEKIDKIDNETNILISYINVVKNKYKLKDLFEKKYTFVLYFKDKNILSWIYVTFIKLNTIILNNQYTIKNVIKIYKNIL